MQTVSARAVSIEDLSAPVAMVENEAYRFSVYHNVKFDSEHVFRGIQTAETGVQRTVRLDYGPFYAGFRGMRPFEDEDISFNRRKEVFGGVKTPLMPGLVLDTGLQAFTLSDPSPRPFGHDGGEDGSRLAVEPILRVQMEAPVRPQLTFSRDIFTRTTTMEAHISGHVPLADDIQIGGHGAFGKVIGGTVPSYHYAGLGADLVTTVSDRVALTAGLQWDRASRNTFMVGGDAGHSRQGSLRWGLALKAGF